MCVHELDVPGSLRRCIRVLLHWNTDKPADEIVHVYVKEAAQLRPDRSNLPPVDWKELEAVDRRAQQRSGQTDKKMIARSYVLFSRSWGEDTSGSGLIFCSIFSSPGAMVGRALACQKPVKTQIRFCVGGAHPTISTEFQRRQCPVSA